MLSTTGRVIMVSGANRGIGRAIAARLIADGFRLSLGTRRADAIAGLASDDVLIHAVDVADRAACEGWVEATADRFGRIDGLVNNAGILRRFTVAEDDEAGLDEMWEVNAKAPLRLTRLVFPHLKEAGHGRIVNIASMSGKRAGTVNVGYTMSKYAVMGLTDSTRRLGWDDGIRATAVCPGMTLTDMTPPSDSPPGVATDPADVAGLVSLALRLPDNAVVAEMLINHGLD